MAGRVEERHFNYIGFRIIQESSALVLDQSRYVENIKNNINPNTAQEKQSTLTAEEQTEYRQLIGQINWAVQGTRPDMAFELIDRSTKLKEGTISDLSRAIKAVNRLKDIRSMISFPALSRNINDWKIVVFTDAYLYNINNGTGSTAGHIIWLMDCHGKCCKVKR